MSKFLNIVLGVSALLAATTTTAFNEHFIMLQEKEDMRRCRLNGYTLPSKIHR